MVGVVAGHLTAPGLCCHLSANCLRKRSYLSWNRFQWSKKSLPSSTLPEFCEYWAAGLSCLRFKNWCFSEVLFHLSLHMSVTVGWNLDPTKFKDNTGCSCLPPLLAGNLWYPAVHSSCASGTPEMLCPLCSLWSMADGRVMESWNILSWKAPTSIIVSNLVDALT